MARKTYDIDDIDTAWQFYLESQSPAFVCRRCNESGINVRLGTVSTWINKGIPSRNIIPFKEKFRAVRKSAVKVMEAVKTAEKRKELVAIGSSDAVDLLALHQEIGNARLADWRNMTDKTLIHTEAACRKVLDGLIGVDPENDIALKNATSSWLNMLRAMKTAVEIHSMLGTIRGGDPDEERDEWVREHFEGWAPEEYKAFQERGVWPESQGPPPDFMTEDD